VLPKSCRVFSVCSILIPVHCEIPCTPVVNAGAVMSQSSGNSGDVVDTVVIGDLVAAHHAHHAIDCILGNPPPTRGAPGGGEVYSIIADQ